MNEYSEKTGTSHEPDQLSLERMRGDLAEILFMDPVEIGDEDDLLDLGLDSIRLMTLAARWNEAGARLAFADLAEHPQLQVWWALVSKSSSAPRGSATR